MLVNACMVIICLCIEYTIFKEIPNCDPKMLLLALQIILSQQVKEEEEKERQSGKMKMRGAFFGCHASLRFLSQLEGSGYTHSSVPWVTDNGSGILR